MDSRPLMVLITKTAGLILMIYTLALFPAQLGTFFLLPERSLGQFLGFVLLPVAIPLITGLALFTFPATTVRSIAGVEALERNGTEALLQSVVFGGIGLYVAIDGILDVVYFGALRVLTRDAYDMAAFAEPTARAELIASVVSIIVGVVLLFRARGLAGLLRRIRS